MKQFLNIKIFQIALVIIISAIMFAGQAYCAEVKDLLLDWEATRGELEALQSKGLLTNSELRSKNELLNLEYNKRESYLREIASLYILGKIEGSEIDKDFKDHPHYQKYISHFSTLLLKESIRILQNSKIAEIKNFMKIYNRVYTDNEIPLFKITGVNVRRDSPTEEKGGFHRSRKSIFMDITRTSSKEWLFIFMHELFHSLDSELSNAIVEFSNVELIKSVQKICQNNSTLAELNDHEQLILSQFVNIGMNRGLFAEYRDWRFGFSVYEEGQKEGLWMKIPFVEDVLSFKDKNESMNQFVYRYLKERAGIREEGFLTKPIVQQKILDTMASFKPN